MSIIFNKTIKIDSISIDGDKIPSDAYYLQNRIESAETEIIFLFPIADNADIQINIK